jgi:hypothetical protein
MKLFAFMECAEQNCAILTGPCCVYLQNTQNETVHMSQMCGMNGIFIMYSE